MTDFSTDFGASTRMIFDGTAPKVSRLTLEITSGPDRGQVIELGPDTLSVGSGRENKVILKDDTVSRCHGEITPTEAGVRVRDLGSTNGTFTGGARITDALMQPGSRFQMGGTEFLVKSAHEDLDVPMSEAEQFGSVLGRSTAMRRVFGILERVAKTNATILLTGETGCGKGALAGAIHAASPRRDKRMVVVDCGAIPATLMESELFGHERGAFTGAVAQRKGAFEQANGSTVFLDELGEMPLELQPKLLRVLENGEVRRVGGEQIIKVSVRVIAATNRELETEVAQGRFREDLYYRLAVIRVRVPALRERPEDIENLIHHFLESQGADPGLVDAETMRALKSHRWPGNVRELRNLVERSVLLNGGVIRPGQVARTEGDSNAAPLSSGNRASLASLTDLSDPFKDAKDRLVLAFEQAYLDALMSRAGSNPSVSELARLSGLDRKHIRTLLERHGRDSTHGDT